MTSLDSLNERVRASLPVANLGAYIAFVAICLIWGTTFLAIRVADETIPTLALTSMRFIGAGTILLTICLVRREKFPTAASGSIRPSTASRW